MFVGSGLIFPFDITPRITPRVYDITSSLAAGDFHLAFACL
jgi:hypothetical protein